MIDFRYHVTSIVAVFLALTIGVVLGLALGDAGLVSDATKNVQRSLRGDLRDARRDADEARDRLATHDRYEAQLYPLIVGGRLEGARIAMVALGDDDRQTNDDVRAAITPAGAKLSSISVIATPPDLAALADRLKGGRFADIETDPDVLKAFGERVGRELITGGTLIRRVQDQLFASRSGTFGPASQAVLMRTEQRLAADERKPTDVLERAIVRGMENTQAPVAGVERTDADPSEVPFFKDNDLSSVDNVDELPGWAALVFVLLGAKGSFGVKEGADQLLPQNLEQAAPAPGTAR